MSPVRDQIEVKTHEKAIKLKTEPTLHFCVHTKIIEFTVHSARIRAVNLQLPSERLEAVSPKEFRSAVVDAFRDLEEGIRRIAAGEHARVPIQDRIATNSLRELSSLCEEDSESLRRRVNRVLGGSRWFNLGGEPHIRLIDWAHFLEKLAEPASAKAQAQEKS